MGKVGGRGDRAIGGFALANISLTHPLVLCLSYGNYIVERATAILGTDRERKWMWGGLSYSEHTSLQIVRSSSHIRRGRILRKKGKFMSASTISSSESCGCRGKLAAGVLHGFTAQVRKLSVRSFIAGGFLSFFGPGDAMRVGVTWR